MPQRNLQRMGHKHPVAEGGEDVDNMQLCLEIMGLVERKVTGRVDSIQAVQRDLQHDCVWNDRKKERGQ